MDLHQWLKKTEYFFGKSSQYIASILEAFFEDLFSPLKNTSARKKIIFCRGFTVIMHNFILLEEK